MKRETIFKIVKASGVAEGEMILIHFWGEDADKKIANDFMTAVSALGATPILLQQARSVNRAIFSVAGAESFDDRYFELFSKFDAVLDVFAYRPVVLGDPIEDGKMTIYRRYMARLFEKLMVCSRFTQIRIPTSANAEESGLEPEDYIQRMNRAYDIDYEQIKVDCKSRLETLEKARRLAVYTGESCVLNFDLTDRSWHMDAGDGDLPCGEVYIAPVEAYTEGQVFFDVFYLDDVKYECVTLEVAHGEVVGSSHPEVAECFARWPRENRMVCELGFGMNPNVESLCGYTVLDEKMVGTFHIAVGANDMFGGTNEASDHIDFVGRGEMEIIQ